MALRLTTAMSLVLATGILAACNDESDAEINTVETAPVVEGGEIEMTDMPADDDVVRQDDVVLMNETAELEGQAGEPDPNVVVADETLDVAEGLETLETEAELALTEAEEALDGIGADTVGPAVETADATPTEDLVPEVDGQTEAALDANEGMDGEAVLAPTEITSAGDALQETPGEVAATLPNAVVDEAQEIAQDRALADDDTAYAAEDDAIVLSNNVTVVGTEDEGYAQADGANVAALDSTGELDAEARAVPGSGEMVAVEETNDVATDGIDSGSELTMTDLDDLQLDQTGVERLTSFIENSDAFTATQKITIVAGIDAARDDPQRFTQLMDQIRDIVASAE